MCYKAAASLAVIEHRGRALCVGTQRSGLRDRGCLALTTKTRKPNCRPRRDHDTGLPTHLQSVLPEVVAAERLQSSLIRDLASLLTRQIRQLVRHCARFRFLPSLAPHTRPTASPSQCSSCPPFPLHSSTAVPLHHGRVAVHPAIPRYFRSDCARPPQRARHRCAAPRRRPRHRLRRPPARRRWSTAAYSTWASS